VLCPAARQAAEEAKQSNLKLQEDRKRAAREQQQRDEQLMQDTIRWVQPSLEGYRTSSVRAFFLAWTGSMAFVTLQHELHGPGATRCCCGKPDM
jgi:hypothetical protein